MTAYFQPLARRVGGRFDYTRKTGSTHAHPIGYCSGGPGPGVSTKYHDDGHATADEAIACYRDFEIDTAVSYRETPDQQKKCATCGAWTTGGAHFGGESFHRPIPLCPEHQTRDDVARAVLR